MTQSLSVESVKALVAEFFNRETLNEKGFFMNSEYHMMLIDKPYVTSVSHEVSDGIYMYWTRGNTWYVHNTNQNRWYYFNGIISDIHGESFLWEVEVESTDKYASTSMLIVAPTRRVAELQGKYDLLDSKWGPRKVYGSRCVARVNTHKVPNYMSGYNKAIYV